MNMNVREALDLAKEIQALKKDMPLLAKALEEKFYNELVRPPAVTEVSTSVSAESIQKLTEKKEKDTRYPQGETNYIIPFTTDEVLFLQRMRMGHYSPWHVNQFLLESGVVIQDMYGVSTYETIRTGGDHGKPVQAYAVYDIFGIHFSELAFLHVKRNSSYDRIMRVQRRQVHQARKPLHIYEAVLMRLWLTIRRMVREAHGKENGQMMVSDEQAVGMLYASTGPQSKHGLPPLKLNGEPVRRVGYVSADPKEIRRHWLGGYLCAAAFSPRPIRKQTPSLEARARAKREAEEAVERLDGLKTKSDVHLEGTAGRGMTSEPPDDHNSEPAAHAETE